jgi:formate C-acetyltransferase
MIDFFYGAAQSGAQGLQLNCVSRAMLLDAQKHPENYRHLIVRVCGFSMYFVLLSKEYQDEFISRLSAET